MHVSIFLVNVNGAAVKARQCQQRFECLQHLCRDVAETVLLPKNDESRKAIVIDLANRWILLIDSALADVHEMVLFNLLFLICRQLIRKGCQVLIGYE
jgi:hypothetical protein